MPAFCLSSGLTRPELRRLGLASPHPATYSSIVNDQSGLMVRSICPCCEYSSPVTGLTLLRMSALPRLYVNVATDAITSPSTADPKNNTSSLDDQPDIIVDSRRATLPLVQSPSPTGTTNFRPPAAPKLSFLSSPTSFGYHNGSSLSVPRFVEASGALAFREWKLCLRSDASWLGWVVPLLSATQ